MSKRPKNVTKLPTAKKRPVKQGQLSIRKGAVPENVEFWQGITNIPVNVTHVLEGAIEADLNDVLVLGRYPDGEYYFAASHSDSPKHLYIMKQFERLLVEMGEDIPRHT